jgi:hypothetical protein
MLLRTRIEARSGMEKGFVKGAKSPPKVKKARY